MKLKFYLRGLGVGLIVTTLILTVANGVKNSKLALAENNNNLNTATVNSLLNPTKSADASLSSTAATTAESTLSSTQSNDSSTESSQATVTNETQAPQSVTQPQTREEITVVLNNIMYSEKAAQVIAEAGIVSDWKDFNSFLSNTGYAVKIHNGTYTLYKGQDYESIAKIISGIK